MMVQGFKHKRCFSGHSAGRTRRRTTSAEEAGFQPAWMRECCPLLLYCLRLLADAEFGDDGLIALGIVFFEVVEQATTPADQHEKAAARAVIFLVRLEVSRQLTNALAEQRDLYFRAAGIRIMRAIRVNNGLFLLSG